MSCVWKNIHDLLFFGLMTPSKRILDDFGCSFHKRRIKPAVVELNDLQICRRETPLDRGKKIEVMGPRVVWEGLERIEMEHERCNASVTCPSNRMIPRSMRFQLVL